MSLDRNFRRPFAHRGLHGAQWDTVENTAGAFQLAVDLEIGIECDLQASVDGSPVVYHDFTLDRLTEATGRIDAHNVKQLQAIPMRGTSDRILSFEQLLEMVAGVVPIIAEVKADWRKPLPTKFLEHIATLAQAYDGPLALMSFHVEAVAALSSLAPEVSRGLVSRRFDETEMISGAIDAATRDSLSHLVERQRVGADFVAYFVRDLPTSATRYIREVETKPVFAWTVRTETDLALAADHADIAIFEDLPPVRVAKAFIEAGRRSQR